MNFGAEFWANLVTAVSILLAARNHVHTWWTGIVGCLLFGWVFFTAKLYADVTLQVFFITTSVIGWMHWLRRGTGAEGVTPIVRTPPGQMLAVLGAGALVAAAYGALLHHFTDAYLPYVDALVMSLSVIAQLLLMARRLETWVFWVLVDLISVPLYLSRELRMTAALYAAFLVMALYGGWQWWRLWQQQGGAPAVTATAS